MTVGGLIRQGQSDGIQANGTHSWQVMVEWTVVAKGRRGLWCRGRQSRRVEAVEPAGALCVARERNCACLFIPHRDVHQVSLLDGYSPPLAEYNCVLETATS
jgi:hypothetical protein